MAFSTASSTLGCAFRRRRSRCGAMDDVVAPQASLISGSRSKNIERPPANRSCRARGPQRRGLLHDRPERRVDRNAVRLIFASSAGTINPRVFRTQNGTEGDRKVRMLKHYLAARKYSRQFLSDIRRCARRAVVNTRSEIRPHDGHRRRPMTPKSDNAKSLCTQSRVPTTGIKMSIAPGARGGKPVSSLRTRRRATPIRRVHA